MHDPPRGHFYGPIRHTVERLLTLAYRGDWPARIWSRVPGACAVRPVQRELGILPVRYGGPPAPIRVAFVSDLHIGPTTPVEIVLEAARIAREFEPDLLLFGGDYVFLRATEARLSTLANVLPKFFDGTKTKALAVFGNHDLWTHSRAIGDVFAAANITMLTNEAYVRPDLAVVGVDDPWTGNADVAKAYANVPAGCPVILLTHAPETIDFHEFSKESHRTVLTVCGHTHGGHIAPFGRPVIVPGATGKMHPAGFYDVVRGGASSLLFVSRGIGATESALRMGAPPDIGLFTLTARPAP